MDSIPTPGTKIYYDGRFLRLKKRPKFFNTLPLAIAHRGSSVAEAAPVSRTVPPCAPLANACVCPRSTRRTIEHAQNTARCIFLIQSRINMNPTVSLSQVQNDLFLGKLTVGN